MYNKVSTDLNFVARERDVAQLWKEKDIVHKSFALRDDSKEHFTFFDGPPTLISAISRPASLRICSPASGP